MPNKRVKKSTTTVIRQLKDEVRCKTSEVIKQQVEISILRLENELLKKYHNYFNIANFTPFAIATERICDALAHVISDVKRR